MEQPSTKMDAASMISTVSDFKYITFDDSLKLINYKQGAHCAIYCKNSRMILHKEYATKASISMQLRFDGRLGFPGGRVTLEEGIVKGLNRELEEETNLAPHLFISQDNYLFSHQHDESNQCLHFYAKQVSLEQFQLMEKDALHAEHYGDETMGIVRVPLFTLKDGYRGFPAFLSNSFAGNAKDQLLNLLLQAKILDVEEIEDVLKKSESKL